MARAQIPKDVSIIAAEVGLLSSEVDLFGKKKAKVALSTLKRLEERKNGKYIVVAGNHLLYIVWRDNIKFISTTLFYLIHQIDLEEATYGPQSPV